MKAFNELKDLSTKDLIERMDKYSKMGGKSKIFRLKNPSLINETDFFGYKQNQGLINNYL
jgi:hypothetical protein